MKKEEHYKKKFNQIKDTIHLMEGEEIVHCMDKDSFQGRYYSPKWALTNRARMYSLSHNKWCKSFKKGMGKKLKDGTYPSVRDCIDKTYVHLLVANYFCDKTVIKLYGEKNVQVHHINQYDKNKSCTENNNSDNIQYVYTKDHNDIVSKIQRGKYIVPDGTDVLTRFAINSISYHEGSTVSMSYDESGNKVINLCLQLGEGKKVEKR